MVPGVGLTVFIPSSFYTGLKKTVVARNIKVLTGGKKLVVGPVDPTAHTALSGSFATNALLSDDV